MNEEVRRLKYLIKDILKQLTNLQYLAISMHYSEVNFKSLDRLIEDLIELDNIRYLELDFSYSRNNTLRGMPKLFQTLSKFPKLQALVFKFYQVPSFASDKLLSEFGMMIQSLPDIIVLKFAFTQSEFITGNGVSEFTQAVKGLNT